MSALADRIAQVEQQIGAACQQAGRDRAAVTLVAVSKKQPEALIRQAYGLGLRDFGESYAQELKRKAEALADLPELRWHFIGHLQRNKAQQVVGRCQLIHSVDSASLLDRIDQLARQADVTQEVLVQLNLAGEQSKSGAPEASLAGLLTHAAGLEHARCTGLMTMPPLLADPAQLAALFGRLRQLRDRLAQPEPLPWLSMGMSHDFGVAIAQGATHVRVGTAIFGPREQRTA